MARLYAIPEERIPICGPDTSSESGTFLSAQRLQPERVPEKSLQGHGRCPVFSKGPDFPGVGPLGGEEDLAREPEGKNSSGWLSINDFQTDRVGGDKALGAGLGN
jgi:hypothetical protein